MSTEPLLRRLPTFWRRSIQARVVVSIVLLSALVVTAMGWVLLRQITDGLVEERVEAAQTEAASETAEAENRLGATSPTDVDTSAQLRQLMETIVTRGDVRGFEVVLIGPIAGSREADSVVPGTRSSPDLDVASVPASLQDAVRQGPGPVWTFGRVSYLADAEEPSVPGVVTGSQIVLPSDGATYALYFLFPMSEEAETLGLVRRALLTAGVLLVVLLAGVTWLVTRQVVTPVRLARRVAERLAAGRLEERMHVQGQDDIARLGISFNQMASNLQRQIRQLEELSRVQRRFVSDVSHELRTPLTTVRMAGDVLHEARDRFDPVTARSAELLQTELDRFETLLADLLEISRFDAGAAVLDLEDVNLVDVVRRVVDAMEPVARRRDVRVVVKPDGPCIAEVDVRRVERVVRNLVSNAIDHAESGDVVISLAADDEAAALAVRDYGVGLGPGEAAMVFNRFWRADPARARTSGGTGLGLAIALEDARLHGGWLQAWGQPGGGAQFRLTLPRRAGDPLTRSPLPLIPRDAGRTRHGAGAPG